MLRVSRFAILVLALTLTPAVRAGGKEEEGFRPLFNGKDLSGWVNVNGAPSTFFVQDDMIITTGRPTGFLRTDKQYENFILEFDWFHKTATPKAVGNSGLFVWADPVPAKGTGYTRGIEVQVLVNFEVDWATSDGDIFSIWGATCKPDRPHPKGMERCLPSERRSKGANEWNHYRVEARDGVIKLAVNGKVVSGVSQCNPRKGYLALESEGSECRFKNIRIKELPSSNPKPAEVAEVARGFVDMFDGLDLAGWKADAEHKAHWRMNDGFLTYDGKGEDSGLWSEKSYGDFEMQLDWRWTGKRQKDKDGSDTPAIVSLRGNTKSQVKVPADAPAGQWNRMFIRLQGDRLSVTLNGKAVTDNVQLADIPDRGPVALHGDAPIQFGNVFIRPLGKDE